MIEIIREGSFEEKTYHERAFYYPGHVGSWGFSFECDKNGNIFPLSPCATESLRKCLSPESGMIDGGIVDRVHRMRISRIGRCLCGRKVELERFTNTCDCGRDYNSFGQLLAPRSQWGEETGENPADILLIQ